MENYCHRLHQVFNHMPRLRVPYEREAIPPNGIYILFEKGETAHGADRIVRIGTHTGNNNLRSRLHEHFFKENKDRSIFRKNIGRSLLNKSKDPFLSDWNRDLTPRLARENRGKLIDYGKLKQVEREVTNYMQENFSFVVFQVDSADKRLLFEAKIISTVSRCNECTASQTWLGSFSPVEKIRKSGLWLVKGLYKVPLSGENWEELANHLRL